MGLTKVEDGPGGSVYAEYTDRKVWAKTITCRCGEVMTLSFRYNLNKDRLSLTDALHLVIDHRGDEVSMHCNVEQADMSWVMIGMQGVMDFIGSAGGSRCGFPWYGEVEAWLREA